MNEVEISPEVRGALDRGRPVVALESTLISHGLPEDRRIDVARRLEGLVREEGAIPATVAIMDGRLTVGLNDEALERVAFGGAIKASLRDLAFGLVRDDQIFATTVASTMAIAHRVGIRFFATGGIGGVHRLAEQTFDESADLTAFSRYPVLVVCAGPKAVLDLPKTMERLETLGVPVVGYETDELPGFYTASSDVALVHQSDDVREIARLFSAHVQLGGAGFMVAQPPPAESAWDSEGVERLIQEALEDASEQKVEGAAVTPFLLSRLARASGGRSVETNVALLENNARLAAQIAVAAPSD